jgi:GTP-binding protein Era
MAEAQVCFIDTPGVHEPKYKLGENMNQEAIETLEQCDVIIWIIDSSTPPHDEEKIIAQHIQETAKKIPLIMAMNKIDLVDEAKFEENKQQYEALLSLSNTVPISATRGDRLDDLLNLVIDLLPTGYPFYPEDQITDLYEREIAADLIREACLNILRDEVPHGIAIRIDQYIERENQGALIEATIFVEKESHKPILIGKNGSMLKEIGIAARQEIEVMSGRKVFLRLRVKVRKNWRNNESILRRFGY